MSVIPFNPGGARRGAADAAPIPQQQPPQPERREQRPAAGDAAATEDGGPAAHIARLEDALIAALRENATNWARAERAERMLAECRKTLRSPTRPPTCSPRD